MMSRASVIPVERIANSIYLIRGEKVMLDSDLAALYGVATSALNQQVRRNPERFPHDFAFQLSDSEWKSLMSQIVTSNTGRGGRRKPPWVFTEQGVAMLSSVLRSTRAARTNVAIMRTFVKLRQALADHRDIARKLEQHDHEIAILFDTVKKLLAPPESPRKKIGYIHHDD
jgi:hypothetical protein